MKKLKLFLIIFALELTKNCSIKLFPFHISTNGKKRKEKHKNCNFNEKIYADNHQLVKKLNSTKEFIMNFKIAISDQFLLEVNN